MRRALILILAGFLGLTLSDVSVLAKGGSGGHPGPSGHSDRSKPKSNTRSKPKNNSKKKKKKKKSSAKKHKSRGKKVAKGNKKSKKKKSKKHKNSKIAKGNKKSKKLKKKGSKLAKGNKKSKKRNKKHNDSKVTKGNKKLKKDRKGKDVVKGNKKGKGKGRKPSITKFVKLHPRFKEFGNHHQKRIKAVYDRGGRKGLTVEKKFKPKLGNMSKNRNVPKLARDGIKNVMAGKPMSPKQVEAVQKLAGGSAGAGSGGTASLTEEARRAGLTIEDRDALRHALEVDADRQSAFKIKYLAVENFTKDTLTIWIHYRTPSAEKKPDRKERSFWTWQPTPPVRQDEALQLRVEPGKVVQVKDGEDPVVANRVRIWAKASGGALLEKNKNKDYWLVDEPRHEYFADKMQEATYTFNKRTMRRPTTRNEAE